MELQHSSSATLPNFIKVRESCGSIHSSRGRKVDCVIFIHTCECSIFATQFFTSVILQSYAAKHPLRPCVSWHLDQRLKVVVTFCFLYRFYKTQASWTRICSRWRSVSKLTESAGQKNKYHPHLDSRVVKAICEQLNDTADLQWWPGQSTGSERRDMMGPPT